MSRVLTVSLALVLTTALAVPAAGAPKKNPKSPDESAAYWTPERIKNAKPRERARPGGGGGGGKASDWNAFTVTPVPYLLADRQNGKLLMTFPDGNYVCSGTAVNAASGVNLVWTAGHCVTDGTGKEATNLTFIPAYAGGTSNPEPFGRWGFTSFDSTAGWEAQGADRFTHDVGAIRVQRAGMPGATFQETFGTRPIVFGQNPTGQRIAAYGYPAAGKFNGQRQYGCASPFRRWDTVSFRDPMQISCNMTGGSSGGGWFLDGDSSSRAEAGEALISVNSYGYQGEKNTMYGPYMADEGQAEQLYDRLSGLPAD